MYRYLRSFDYVESLVKRGIEEIEMLFEFSIDAGEYLERTNLWQRGAGLLILHGWPPIFILFVVVVSPIVWDFASSGSFSDW